MTYFVGRKPPSIDWWDNHKAIDSLPRTVHEEEPKALDTGLLDQTGTKIWRLPDPKRIGFVVK